MIYGEKFLVVNNNIDYKLSLLENDINQFERLIITENCTIAVNEFSVKEILSTIFEKAKQIIVNIIEWIDRAQAFISRKLSEFILKLINFIKSNPKLKEEAEDNKEDVKEAYVDEVSTNVLIGANLKIDVPKTGITSPTIGDKIRNRSRFKDQDMKWRYVDKKYCYVYIDEKKIESIITKFEKSIIEYNTALVSYSDICVDVIINGKQNSSSIKDDREKLEDKFKQFTSIINDINEIKYEDIFDKYEKRISIYDSGHTYDTLCENKASIDKYSKYLKYLKKDLSEVKKFVASQESKFKQCSKSITDQDASDEIKNVSKNMLSKTSEMIKLSLKGCSKISTILDKGITDIIKSSILIGNALNSYCFLPTDFINKVGEPETLLSQYTKYNSDQSKSNN